ncbi:MAG TPA: HAMP domain-containing protein, partial [Streptosporangiaceae bacterium]|nr:HAMP domain-containing protein [Streptosporangiaceae bacterium]
MTDEGGSPARAGRSETLGLRLALAFLAIALAAVALLAGLTAASAAADVANLTKQQRNQLTNAMAVAAAAAWDKNDSWASADLAPVLDLAKQAGLDVRFRDQAGHPVGSSPGFPTQSGAQSSASMLVGDQRVGDVTARFTGSGLSAADRVLQSDLLRAIAGAAGLAALLALLTGLVVARRITRPVARLLTVTRAMTTGDHAARAGPIRAPAELRELGAAFDQMASTLDRQDQIRRDLVADVAHELRTPIAVLQAGHEALLDGVTEP